MSTTEFPLCLRARASPSWRRALALLVLLAALPAGAQPQLSEREVEAAYLVNFLRFTQWPARSFASPQAPFVVTVVGSAQVASTVRAVAAAAGAIDGHPIEVRSLVPPPGRPLDLAADPEAEQAVRTSHLVFFHGSAGSVPERELARLSAVPVLTVSDIGGFTHSGGMLELSNEANHIVFEANPAAIRDAGLLLSAKVLKLARSTAGMPP